MDRRNSKNAIQRNRLRRLSFPDISPKNVLKETESEQKGERNMGQKDIIKRRNTCSEFYPLSTLTEMGIEETNASHINTTFRADESMKHDSFVAAFGQKGKNIGEFQDAKHVTWLSRNRLLITDFVNNRLQICSDVRDTVTLISPDEILQPWATAVTKDNLIAVTLCQDKCVKILSTDGDIVGTFGKGLFQCPTGIISDAIGNFIVCDSILNQVFMIDSETNFLRCLGNKEEKHQRFSKPYYLCQSPTGQIIVSDTGNHQVKVFDQNGDFILSFGSFGKAEGQFKCPYGICTNQFGDIFVADHYNNRISMYTQDGRFTRHLVTSEHGLVHPQGLALGSDMTLYVTHGHLKASEILVFKLTKEVQQVGTDIISYV